MKHTAPRLFIMFKNSAPLFTMLSNGVIGSRTRSNEYAEQIQEKALA